MSEAPEPLEFELSALRPHEVSPGLRSKIAERLADSPPANSRRLGWIAVSGVLAAACLAAVLYDRGGGENVEPKPIVVRPQPAPSVEVNDWHPTLMAYQRALARSPEDFDALLAKEAVVAPQTNPELVPIGAFTRSDHALRTLLGED